MVKRMRIRKKEHKGTAVWMTAGDSRRRYPIRSSNDRLLCFCVSTALAFPFARAGSTRGFSVSILSLRVLRNTPVFRLSLPSIKNACVRARTKIYVLNANVIKDCNKFELQYIYKREYKSNL